MNRECEICGAWVDDFDKWRRNKVRRGFGVVWENHCIDCHKSLKERGKFVWDSYEGEHVVVFSGDYNGGA